MLPVYPVASDLSASPGSDPNWKVPDMSYHLVTAPAVEPLSLAEARDWLKIDGNQDDTVIAALIVSARLAIEAATGLMLISQRWSLRLDAWPHTGVLALAHAPLQSVVALRVIGSGGQVTSLPPSWIGIAPARRPRLVLNSDLPATDRVAHGIEVECQFGYGDAPSSVPQPLRLAMRMLVAFWHENRGDGIAATASRWPDPVSALLQPFMLRRM